MYSEGDPKVGGFPKGGVFEFIKQSSMKQFEDSINKSMNNSKSKRLLGLEQKKLKLRRGCKYTNRLQRNQDFY